MANHIHQCTSCKRYTLEEKSPSCGTATIITKPTKFTMETKVIDKGYASRVATFKKNLPIPEIVELVEGAQVMLVHNLDISNELVNGSRGVVKAILKEGVYVKFKKSSVVVSKFTWEINGDSGDRNVIALKFTQIPLKLAYAVTIHSAQG